jgi:hypothetical protein
MTSIADGNMTIAANSTATGSTTSRHGGFNMTGHCQPWAQHGTGCPNATPTTEAGNLIAQSHTRNTNATKYYLQHAIGGTTAAINKTAGMNATTTSGMNTATIGCTPVLTGPNNRTCNVPLNAIGPSTSSTNPQPLTISKIVKCEQQHGALGTTQLFAYCAHAIRQ